MKIKFCVVALLIAGFSAYCFATDMNYDTARKVYEAGKEVEAYQKSKMDGTYVDYSVTPTWVSVIYGAIGIGIVGFFGIVFFSWLSDKFSGKKDSRVNTAVTSNSISSNFIYPADPNEQRWATMTVSQIMTEMGQSERFVKAKLARGCIKCLDYDGKKIGAEFNERMQKESEIAKSEEKSAIALLGRLGIESRVIEGKHDESVESSEFKKLKENARNETASAYIRQTTIDGLIMIQRILKMIDKAAINSNITLSEGDKIITLKKKISDETMENFRFVDIFFKKELFTEVFRNFKDSEIDSLSQLVNFALYENASDGTSALRYDFEYFFKMGYLSNRIASSSRGTAYESYSAVSIYIDKNVKNNIDEVVAKSYLKQSVISAEKAIPKLLEKVNNGGIKKSLDKIVTTQVTPVYYYCIYLNSDAFKASRDLRAIINQSPDEYMGLRKILDTLRDEKNAAINELRDTAESGKASIAQLKNLHDLVSSPTDKFKYLAKACTLGLKDKRGKTLINSQNINKLTGYLKVIDISEHPQLRDYFGHDFEPATFIEMLEGKASLKKILNKGVKSRKISENQSFEILSSDRNFSCPACAETIGSNTTICPYCKHKLS